MTGPHSELSAAADCGCASRRNRGVAAHLPLVPAIALALVPKCPLCFGAWFGFLSALGVASRLGSAWQMPLLLAFLSVALGSLAVRAGRRRDYRPLLLGAVGAIALLWGRYAAGPVLLYAGVGLLTGASLWSSGVKRLWLRQPALRGAARVYGMSGNNNAAGQARRPARDALVPLPVLLVWSKTTRGLAADPGSAPQFARPIESGKRPGIS